MHSRAGTIAIRTGEQLALLAVILLCWQYLPDVGFIAHRFHFMDPFFISSPSRVYSTLIDLATGRNGSILVWSYARRTVESALIGTAIGIVSGGLAGLLLSQSPYFSRLFQPLLLVLNAIPRVALIPIFVIIFGPTAKASEAVAISVVFFVVFFVALEGARSVPAQILQNAQILGASGFQTMRQVRLPYAVAWVFAVLPNAVAFGLLSVVTAEVFTGTVGMGRLLLISSSTVNASLTFAVVAILGVIALVFTVAAEALKRRVLHWWV